MRIIKFGELIKHNRELQKLSMYRLAILAGVSRKTIMDIENGVDTRISIAEKICKALEIQFVIGENFKK